MVGIPVKLSPSEHGLGVEVGEARVQAGQLNHTALGLGGGGHLKRGTLNSEQQRKITRLTLKYLYLRHRKLKGFGHPAVCKQ